MKAKTTISTLSRDSMENECVGELTREEGYFVTGLKTQIMRW